MALIYLYVDSKARDFDGYARRFIDSYRKFSPGINHELHIVRCNSRMTPSMIEMFPEADCFHCYTGSGFDIGAQQFIARRIKCDFMVNTCSSTYFRRENWLRRFVEARLQNGDGLYGAMASRESSPHIRTCFYGIGSELFSSYPIWINSKLDSYRFEHRDWSISTWVESLGKPVLEVTWAGCYPKESWRTAPNGYRRGDQSDCIAFDRITDLYDAADPGGRAFYSAVAG